MSVLGLLAGLLLPSPVQAAKQAVTPNPYAPDLSTQFSVAVGQSVGRRGLLGSITGMTGSEADYDLEQLSGNSDVGAPLPRVRPDTVARNPSFYAPRLPDGAIGQGTGYIAGKSNKGFVTDVPGLRVKDRRWGLTGRTLQQPGNVINGTLLQPTDRAPVPRAMQSAYSTHNPNELRLEDQYGDQW